MNLKPCPFCGGINLTINTLPHYISCNVCHTFGPTPPIDSKSFTEPCALEKLAKDVWNRRAGENHEQ